MRAYIVVDLGFGDAGKGLSTDFLVRHLNAGLVVRYNGGAQAGHNVITPDGHHHTFSQFGSGSFLPNVKTYLSQYMVVHPGALLVEGDLLESKGVRNPFACLRLSDQALVITPFHQAANRIREIARGADRHGSCGVGVGEAVEDGLLHPEQRILAGDLNNPTSLKRKLRTIREFKREQIHSLLGRDVLKKSTAREHEIFEHEDVIDAWIASLAQFRALDLVTPDSVLEQWLRETENVIFEGAQGVLLDGDAGFHPYTTWSNCSAANALELVQELSPETRTFQIGVMRAYAVRHGPGPLPTEAEELASLIREHNRENEWQGTVRYGWFDAVLARYALRINGRIDSLMVTHLDVLPKLITWKLCRGYQASTGLAELAPSSILSENLLTDLHLPADLSLEQRAQVTQALSSVRPVLEDCEPNDKTVIPSLEALLGQPVGMVSRGPSAADVEILNSLPM